jgi:hypothetical protein
LDSGDLQGIVYSAFYRVVRSAHPDLNAFLASTVHGSLPAGPSPTGWPDFWWESLVVEIQGSVMTRKEYISNFDKDWLAANQGQTWAQVVGVLGSNLVPLA